MKDHMANHNIGRMTSLLGFVDASIGAETVVDSFTSKIGGHPVVTGGHTVELTCRVCCKATCILVCQIYCPVDELYHRTLYIFCCPCPPCHRNSTGWMVLRVQNPIEIIKPAVQKPAGAVKQPDIDWGTADSDDWGTEDADDWGEDNSTSTVDNSWALPKPSTPQTVETIEEPCPEVKPVDIDELISSVDGLSLTLSESVKKNDFILDSYYISVTEDQSQNSGDGLSKQSRQLLEQFESGMEKQEKFESKGGASSSKQSKESYEKTSIAHGDKTFYKFTKTLSLNPTQIIRYDFGGDALPMTSVETSQVPRCENCGSKRIFELQIMPAFIQSLQIKGESFHLDIGTVIIYTCAESCWAGKTCLEYPIVQHDPDEHLFSKIS